MSLNAIRSVRELCETERETIEHLVGQPLGSDQQVFILVYTPGIPPDEAKRQAAFQRLFHVIDQADAAAGSVAADEADVAIEEAMRHVRSRTR